jgi:hypothetical protein
MEFFKVLDVLVYYLVLRQNLIIIQNVNWGTDKNKKWMQVSNIGHPWATLAEIFLEFKLNYATVGQIKSRLLRFQRTSQR